jgi:hypothetical protein
VQVAKLNLYWTCYSRESFLKLALLARDCLTCQRLDCFFFHRFGLTLVVGPALPLSCSAQCVCSAADNIIYEDSAIVRGLVPPRQTIEKLRVRADAEVTKEDGFLDGRRFFHGRTPFGRRTNWFFWRTKILLTDRLGFLTYHGFVTITTSSRIISRDKFCPYLSPSKWLHANKNAHVYNTSIYEKIITNNI